MIEFTCPSCGTPYCVPDERAGMRGKCKQCGNAMVVPSFDPGLDEVIDPADAMAAATGSRDRHRRFDKPTVNDLLTSRPMNAQKEGHVRRRNIIIVGIMLLIGFALPVLTPTPGGYSLSFPSIEGIGVGGNVLMIISLLFPLLAGIGAIVIGKTMNVRERGWLILLLGLIPIFLTAIQSFQQGRLPIFGNLMGMEGVAIFLSLLLLVGYYCMFIGARVRWYRPNKAASYTVGVVGGLAMLVFLCFPVAGIPIIAACFMSIFYEPLIGFVVVIATICVLVAAIASLSNSTSRPLRASSKRARLIYLFLFTSLISLLLVMAISMVSIAGMGMPGVRFLVVLVFAVKILAVSIGTLLLAPMGVIDLMIGEIQRPGHCYACDYDLRGITSGTCPECGYQNQAATG